VAAWSASVFGGVVSFAGGQASYELPAPVGEQRREPAGAAADVIDALAAVLTLDAETRAAALTFAGVEAASPPVITPPAAGSGGLR
jgi:hypothetical protein